MFFARPPCFDKSFVTVGAFGLAISATLSVRVVSSLYWIVAVSPFIVTFLIRPSTPWAVLILAIRVAFSGPVGLLKSLTIGFSVGLRFAFLTARLPWRRTKPSVLDELFAPSTTLIWRVSVWSGAHTRFSFNVTVDVPSYGAVSDADVTVSLKVPPVLVPHAWRANKSFFQLVLSANVTVLTFPLLSVTVVLTRSSSPE